MARQFISFQIGSKMLCVDVMTVREIRAWTTTTSVPQTASYERGVLNLRGVAIPVIDLSDRLGWGACAPTERHVIMVTEVAGQQLGLIVDAVNDIVAITPEEVQTPPTGSQQGSSLIEGIASVGGEMALILDQNALQPAAPRLAA